MLISVHVSTKENQHIVGIAFTDFTTNKLGVSEFIDNELYNNFEFLLVQLNAQEVLVREQENQDKLDKIACLSEKAGLKVIRLRKSEFKTNGIEEYLNKDSLKILSYIETKTCHRAIEYVIHYMHANDSIYYEKFELYQYNLSQYMKLDIPALRALSLFSDHHCESNKNMSLYGFLNRCKTSIGSRLLSQWIKQPLIDQNEIGKRHTLVEAFSNHIEIIRDIQEFLKSFPDIFKLSRKFQKRNATLEEVVRIYQMIVKLPNLINALEKIDYYNYSALIEEMYLLKLKEFHENFKKYEELIETTIDFDATNNHEWIIKSEFDKSLHRLLNELNEIKSKIEEEHLRVGEDLEQDTIKKLKLEQSEIHGWCLRLTRAVIIDIV